MINRGLPWKRLTILSLIAGIVYNSWPLGYALNPAVAHHGLASELAGVNQPYNWVFIYGDVVGSLIMLFVIWKIWLDASHYKETKLVWVTLGGVVLFCISASVAALCPVQCVSAVQQCPSFEHNPITLLHAITSVLAGLGLLVAVTGLWWKKQRDYYLTIQFIVFFLTGSWALIILFIPGKNIFVQNTFIALSSLCIAAFPWGFNRAYGVNIETKISL
jgi:hypothetical protein